MRSLLRTLAHPALCLAVALALPAVAGAQDVAQASARQAIVAFLAQWRAAWQASELKRHDVPERPVSDPYFGGNRRLQRLHCHGWAATQPVQVVASRGMRLCPSFAPPGEELPGDERLDADAALVPEEREKMRTARAALLDTLAGAARLAPGDAWLTGQRVRFLVEQGSHDAARAVTRDCRAAASWCALLAGWVEHEGGHALAAESTFVRALAAMPEEERCRWTDLGPLLDGRRARSRHREASCARREAEAARFWWLADPLWSEAGNDRWTEQVARRVVVALRGAVEVDARSSWRTEHGGDAVANLVLRFGWPSYFWWGGALQDGDHYGWTQESEQRWGVAPGATFWAPEYARGRLQLTPEDELLEAPFAPAAWDLARLVAPPGRDDRWTPREHYAPPRGVAPLAPLADVQVALLRRAGGTLVGAATDPAAVVGRRLLLPAGDSVVAALAVATAPESASVVAERRLDASDGVVLSGMVRGDSAIVSLELRPARTRAASRAPRRRARLAVRLPASLAASGTLALSDPVLVDATAGDTVAEGPEVLARRMLGGASLGDRGRVAIYWESYGAGAGDTLEVTLRVVRRREGLLARLGAALSIPGFRGEGRDAAALRWTDVPRATGLVRDEGGVPIRAWVRTLDVRALPAGSYHVEVALSRAGATVTSGQRSFTMRR